MLGFQPSHDHERLLSGGCKFFIFYYVMYRISYVVLSPQLQPLPECLAMEKVYRSSRNSLCLRTLQSLGFSRLTQSILNGLYSGGFKPPRCLELEAAILVDDRIRLSYCVWAFW
jgi:hypothetical protein